MFAPLRVCESMSWAEHLITTGNKVYSIVKLRNATNYCEICMNHSEVIKKHNYTLDKKYFSKKKWAALGGTRTHDTLLSRHYIVRVYTSQAIVGEPLTELIANNKEHWERKLLCPVLSLVCVYKSRQSKLYPDVLYNIEWHTYNDTLDLLCTQWSTHTDITTDVWMRVQLSCVWALQHIVGYP